MARDYMSIIRNLLNKAEDSATTPEESEALVAKAQELMVKFQIDQETAVAAGTEKREELGTRTAFRDEKGKRIVKARRELYMALANLNSCRVVLHGANGRDGVTMFGHRSDLFMVDTLYASLVIQLHTALSTAQRAGEVHGQSGAVSYAHGWVRRVIDRLNTTKFMTTVESPGNALVLVDRSAVVQAKINETYGNKLRKVKLNTSVRDLGAYGVGDRDGQNADLGGVGVAGAVRPEVAG